MLVLPQPLFKPLLPKSFCIANIEHEQTEFIPAELNTLSF